MTLETDITEECPILQDNEFLKQHPGIINVALFIQEVAATTERTKGHYELFNQLGIKTISEYISLIKQKDPNALESYKSVRDILGFQNLP